MTLGPQQTTKTHTAPAAWALLATMFAAGCGGNDPAQQPLDCGGQQCAPGQVCCLDCDGSGACVAPGTPCAGTACKQTNDDKTRVACGDTSCTASQTCCIDCLGHGTCGGPGLTCGQQSCVTPPPQQGPHELTSLDQGCVSPGFTGNAVLAQIAAESEVTMAYHPAEQGRVTGLSFTAHYAGGKLMCYPLSDPCAHMGCAIASEPTRIEIELELEMVTDDGALAETFTTTVSASEYGGGTSFESVRIAADELEGNLDFAMPGHIDLTLIIGGWFSQGTVFKEGRSVDDPQGVRQPVATWPAPPEAIGLTGAWGGAHLALDLDARPRALEFDCAVGTIDAPVLPDRNGKFTVAGTYTAGTGGPAAPSSPTPTPVSATYRGWTDGQSEMLLSVKVEGVTEELGPFSLRLDQQPQLERCL